MKKRIGLTIAVIMMLVSLGSCAPSQPGATPSPSPLATPSPAPTPEPTDNAAQGETGDVTTPKGLEDGVYMGNSEEDDRGNYGEVSITIANEEITEVKYTEYSGENNPKSAENGYEYEEALKAIEELPKQLIETQDVDKIDDYSGATGTTDKFRTAAKKALGGSPQEGNPEQGDNANGENGTPAEGENQGEGNNQG